MFRNVICPHQDATFGAQSVSYTDTAGSTTGWNPGPTAVLVWTTTDAYVRVGESVTATSAATPIPAYTPIVLDVPPGSGGTWRVSAIRVASSGTVYAKPLTA